MERRYLPCLSVCLSVCPSHPPTQVLSLWIPRCIFTTTLFHCQPNVGCNKERNFFLHLCAKSTVRTPSIKGTGGGSSSIVAVLISNLITRKKANRANIASNASHRIILYSVSSSSSSLSSSSREIHLSCKERYILQIYRSARIYRKSSSLRASFRLH